ncbi:hypothetical protein CQW23_05047 [Capsicum baccatum]|uniref:Peptidase M16 N-terminal domain-containing protein n=1 Tax=Capsicum baccatum TaxID=33114 RepID=A0A2G2XGT3_CAPBA|nr:hypothetical protein CQW23_05047 [Capsicum baccatum]
MEPSSVEKEKVGEEEEWEYYEEEEEEYEPDEFDLLEPIEMLDYQEQLPTTTFEVEYGVLDNGLTYYIKRNEKPKDVTHASLVVKAGVICEEENERGAAHLIEHLALEGYGYSNSDALEYLQAFKDQCGAHQNAITSRDHTFYDFSVNNLVDLKKTLGLIAAISLELRFSSDELEKEKCVVSDELWHDSQNVEKQLYNTRIAHVFQGTKRGMSVIYAGFMYEKKGCKCVNDLSIYIQENLLQRVILRRLNEKFSGMSKVKEFGYYTDADSQMYTVYVVSLECEGYATVEVLEKFLVEIARLRVHGIEESELSDGLNFWRKLTKKLYLSSHDHSSEDLQTKCTKHFVYSQTYLPPKLQAQLMIALTERINMEQMKSFCQLQWEAEMNTSLQRISDLEKERSFARWSDEEVEHSNYLIPKIETESGNFDHVEHSDIGAVELILSNGMQVTYQCTEDVGEVRLSGFSYGGLSELPEADILSCSFSGEIGQNVWAKSYKGIPMACDKVNFHVAVDEYKRAFSADFDLSDIELALQIVYLIFTRDLEPEEEDLQAVADELKERLSPERQHLQQFLVNTAKKINSGSSCFYKGGIPRPSTPIMEFQRGKLTLAPFHFPPNVTT